MGPSHTPKVVYTDNSMEFGRACEGLSWNHRTSTPHRSETNGIAERAVRRVKEGTAAVLSQSGLDEKWWADAMECHCYLRNVQDLLADGKTPYERRFGEPFKRANNTFWSNGWISSDFTERSGENSSIWQESVTRNLSGLWAHRGTNLERRYIDGRPGRFGKVGRIKYLSSENQREGSIDQTKRWWIHIPNRRWYSKIVRKRLRIPRTHSKAGTTCKERRFQQNRWRWSPCRLRVDPRWLHLPPSQ